MHEMDAQSVAALGVVGITALAFLIRWLRRKKGGGCGSCGCSAKTKKLPVNQP